MNINILRKDFDLQQEDDTIYFLREMFNLKSELCQLANQLDLEKGSILQNIHLMSTKMPSLHSRSPAPTTRPGLLTICEGTEPGLGEAFGNDQVRTVLDEMSWEIDSIPHGVCFILRLRMCVLINFYSTLTSPQS